MAGRLALDGLARLVWCAHACSFSCFLLRSDDPYRVDPCPVVSRAPLPEAVRRAAGWAAVGAAAGPTESDSVKEATVLQSSPTSAMSWAYDTVRSTDWRIKPRGTAARVERPVAPRRVKRLSASVA